MKKTLSDSYKEAVKTIKGSKGTDAEKKTALFYYSIDLLETIGRSFSSFEIAVCYLFLNTDNDVHRLILIDKYAERCLMERQYRSAIDCYDTAKKIAAGQGGMKDPLFIREMIRIDQIAGISCYMDGRTESAKALFKEALRAIHIAEEGSIDMTAEKTAVKKCLEEVSK